MRNNLRKKVLALILVFVIVLIALTLFSNSFREKTVEGSQVLRQKTQAFFKEPEEGSTGVKEEVQKGVLGKSIVMEDSTFTVLSTNKYESKNPNLLPKKGDMYVAVEVEVKNNSGKEIQLSPYDFLLIDSKKGTYSYTITDISLRIVNRPLQSSEVVKGFLTFAIPSGTTPKKVVYSSQENAGKKIEVDLLLK